MKNNLVQEEVTLTHMKYMNNGGFQAHKKNPAHKRGEQLSQKNNQKYLAWVILIFFSTNSNSGGWNQASETSSEN